MFSFLFHILFPILRCRKIGDEFLQLYKKEWKYAMTELNKSEDEKENIEFLLKIIEVRF